MGIAEEWKILVVSVFVVERSALRAEKEPGLWIVHRCAVAAMVIVVKIFFP